MTVDALVGLDTAWETFEQVAATAAVDVADERARGVALAREFRERGHLRLTPSAALRLSDLAVAAFYRTLRGAGVPAPRDASPAWMLQSDYGFVNVRASSPDPERAGRVTDALKVIPTMRVSAIHLAPFFDCCMENLYAVDSVRVVADAVLDPALTAAGLDGDDQIRLLVDGIHALGWRVGFDLEPHTSTFSRVALAHPGAFRWLHFDDSRAGLAGGATQEEMLAPEAQARLVREVSARVAEGLAEFGLAAVEDLSQGPARVRDCHQALTRRLIADGYWTLLSHTWGGMGLPSFDHYDDEGNYPDYEYLDADGEDHHEHAFGMLSPFKLYDPLPLNRAPLPEDEPLPLPVKEAHALLGGIFPAVRARYGFDFVRLDYVDHVFDSVLEDTVDVPLSDRLTPAVLEMLLDTARRSEGAAGAVAGPAVGAMAERMGCDAAEYGSLGFNLLLGADVLTAMHAEYVSFLLQLQRKLDDPETPSPFCSVLAALDTHDSGHPLFWTRPLSDVVGADGLALRHFLARFSTCGPRRRPKYECMGNQDLSTGLYAANNHPVSLHWCDSVVFNRRYHALEDVYGGLRDWLGRARMGPSQVDLDEGWAAWFLDAPTPTGGLRRLLCVVATEPVPEGKIADWAEEPPELEPVGPIEVDVTRGCPLRDPTVQEIPLDGGEPVVVALTGTILTIPELPPRACRLFHIQ